MTLKRLKRTRAFRFMVGCLLLLVGYVMVPIWNMGVREAGAASGLFMEWYRYDSRCPCDFLLICSGPGNECSTSDTTCYYFCDPDPGNQ